MGGIFGGGTGESLDLRGLEQLGEDEGVGMGGSSGNEVGGSAGGRG